MTAVQSATPNPEEQASTEQAAETGTGQAGSGNGGAEERDQGEKAEGLSKGYVGRAKWLLMIYFDIESPELIEPTKAELLELLNANLDIDRGADVRVFVQLTGLQFEGRNFRGTRRYEIRNRRLVAISAKNYKRSSARSLKDFIVDVLRTKEKEGESDGPTLDARKKLLIIWGHGAGVGVGLEPIVGKGTRLRTLPPPTAIARDYPSFRTPVVRFSNDLDDSEARIMSFSKRTFSLLIDTPADTPIDARQGAVDAGASTVIEAALLEVEQPESKRKGQNALQPGAGKKPHPFDLVIFDSCFMSSAEVAYQLRKVTRYFIASQGLLGFPGLDLTRVLTAIRDLDTSPVWAAQQSASQDQGKEEDAALLALGKRIVNQAIELDAGALGLSLYRLQRLNRTIDHDPATYPACPVSNTGNSDYGECPCVEDKEEHGVRHFRDRMRQLVAALQLGVWRQSLRRQIRAAFSAASTLEVRQFVDLADLVTRLQRIRGDENASSTRDIATRFEAEFICDVQELPMKPQPCTGTPTSRKPPNNAAKASTAQRIASEIQSAAKQVFDIIEKECNCDQQHACQVVDRINGVSAQLYKTLRKVLGEDIDSDAQRIREAAEDLESLLADPDQFLAYHQARRRSTGEEQGVSIYCPWFNALDDTRPRKRDVRVDADAYSRLDFSKPRLSAERNAELPVCPKPASNDDCAKADTSDRAKVDVGTGWADFIFTVSGHMPGSEPRCDRRRCVETVRDLLEPALALGGLSGGGTKNDGQAREVPDEDES